MARRIVETVDPLQVILFGSHARADARTGSDVDLLVVLSPERDEEAARRSAHAVARDFSVPADVIVATTDRVRRLGDVVGTVFRPALLEGRILYDATANIPWDQSRWANELEVAHYPGDWAPPTLAEAQEAVPLARSIVASVERDLGAHGFVGEG